MNVKSEDCHHVHLGQIRDLICLTNDEAVNNIAASYLDKGLFTPDALFVFAPYLLNNSDADNAACKYAITNFGNDESKWQSLAKYAHKDTETKKLAIRRCMELNKRAAV